MKLGEVQKCYDAMRQVISPINKSTGLDWQIGGGEQVTLWVDIPSDFKNAGVQKQVSDGLQAIVKKYLPSEVPMDMLEIGAEGSQAWVDFRNSAMSRISVEDFLKLGKAIVKEGSDVIMDAFGGVEAPTESKKNEKSYLLDADDRNILNRHFYSDSDMDLLERNFGMLKFVDSFFPDNKTNGTATQTEISAEDAETMVGDHESFLVLCMDTLANKDGFDYQVYRVYGPEGTDYITCSYK